MTAHWMLLADGSRHYLGGYEMAYNEYKVPVLAHHIAQLARFTGAAKVLLVFGSRIDVLSRYSDYKKFSVGTEEEVQPGAAPDASR